MSLMTPERIDDLVAHTGHEWRAAIDRWTQRDRVVLYDELPTILGRAVCAWAGVPLGPDEATARIRDLRSLFDDAGQVGWRHVRSRLARKRLEAWLSRWVVAVRENPSLAPEGSPAAVMVRHRDRVGDLLPPRIVAVELLNLLRPTVAVSVYIVLVAHALHENPSCIPRLKDNPEYVACFIEEVRRFYPFFPAVIARVREDFVWQGRHFPRGARALLDLYGTNHDPTAWEKPELFRPERFINWPRHAFSFIPQGGGDANQTHRCPGEDIVKALMRQAVEVLTQWIRYEVPWQVLAIDRKRLPAVPRSGFVIKNVKIKL